MSILGAIKAQSGTLTDLAKLPQALIMQMAQKGQIAQDMVMPILSKKAEMVEAARAMQNAQQQGGVPPTTVLEQIMQQNAVAEQPAPQMQQERGLESLDTGRMNPEQYAGGGIVAFEGGGEVPSYAGPQGSVVRGEPFPVISPQVQAERDVIRRQILLQELKDAQGANDAVNVARLQREIRRMEPAAPSLTRGLRAAAESMIPSAAAGERTGFIEDPMQAAPERGAPREVPPVAPPVPTKPKVGIATVAPPAPAAPPPAAPPPPAVEEEKALPKVEVTAAKDAPPELVAPVFKPQLLTGRGFDVAQDKARAEEFATSYGIDTEYFKKQRDKLEKEGAEIPKEQEQAKWMALAEAGLAIAAGDSPYALQNIAKGGGRGLEAYKGYQKDIREKQRLLKDRDAKITEAEQLEKRGQSNAAMARRDKAMENDERIAEINAKAMSKAEEDNLKATFGVQKALWDRYNLTEDQEVLANREILLQGARDKAAMERIVVQVAGQKDIAQIGASKLDVIPAKDLAALRMQVETMYGPAIKKKLIDKYGSNADINKEYRAQLNAKLNEVMGESSSSPSQTVSPSSGFRLLPD